MSDNILLKIHEELVAIRELLAKGAAAPARPVASAGSSSSVANEPPLQPTALVDDPGSVLVPFGKNKGRPLSELAERSLEWYAADQPPRLDSSGKPYPPRPADIAFKNAARQLYHTQKGTLTGPGLEGKSAEPKQNQPPPPKVEEDTGEVPF